MKKVKFNKAGKWAEGDTLLPQFEVVKGDVREVSSELADIIVGAKCGAIVANNRATGSAADKAAADKEPSAEDKEKAETK